MQQRFSDLIDFMNEFNKKNQMKKKAEQEKKVKEQAKSTVYDRYEIKEDQFWRTKLKGTGRFCV